MLKLVIIVKFHDPELTDEEEIIEIPCLAKRETLVHNVLEANISALLAVLLNEFGLQEALAESLYIKIRFEYILHKNEIIRKSYILIL